jgi:hypothetical protein
VDVLQTHFESRGAPEDLDAAILLHYDGLELLPDESSSLRSLAHILHAQFELTGQVADLNAAEAASSKSLDLLPQRHADTCSSQFVLGRVLLSKYLHTCEQEYFDKSMAAFWAAAQCDAAPALLRISCTKSWAAYTEYCAQPSLEAYKIAFELLPHLALLGMNLWSQYDMLKSTGLITSLACDATACAIQSNDFETAVELLEAGCTVFWSQVLQLCTPLDEIKAVSPPLAEKLRDISQALDKRSLQDDSWNLLATSTEQLTMEQESDHYRRLSVAGNCASSAAIGWLLGLFVSKNFFHPTKSCYQGSSCYLKLQQIQWLRCIGPDLIGYQICSIVRFYMDIGKCTSGTPPPHDNYMVTWPTEPSPKLHS